MTENREPFVFYTSGSTGEPKIVRKSYECLFNEAIDLAKFFGFSKDIVFVSTVSDEFMYGTTFTLMLPKVLGCKVDGERVVYPEDIKNYDKFVFVSTPSFLEKLAKYNYTFKQKPEMIISAGAKLDDKIFEYLENISNGVTEIYGSTEAGVIAYRQSASSRLNFFDAVKYDNGKISSPYFDESELELNDELEFFQDGFVIKQRNDRIVKIQEKRISLDEIEKVLNTNNFIEKSYCLKLDDKLCVAVVLNNDGKIFLENNGKLELVKKIKKTNPCHSGEGRKGSLFILPKKWRFLTNLPVNDRGKIDSKRIQEWFNTNITYPNVVGFFNDGQNSEIDLIFPKNSNFFNGHFPDFPILPGVVQLFFAKEFAKDVYNLDFVPQKVKKIKFSSIIKPECKVKLVLSKKEGSVDFKYISGEKTFSSGTFVL